MTRDLRSWLQSLSHRVITDQDTEQEKLNKHGKQLILCGPHSQPLFALTRSGFLDRIGMDNVSGDMDAALARARQILEQKKQ